MQPLAAPAKSVGVNFLKVSGMSALYHLGQTSNIEEQGASGTKDTVLKDEGLLTRGPRCS